MELYIPPPSSFLPRLPPPRPVVPAVPLVPLPDLPDTIHAPEGAYSLTPSLFCSVGTPAAPMVYDTRPNPASAAAFIGGAGGFVMSPPPQSQGPTGQTAMSFGSSIVNGQTQPAFPVRMSFVNVWFPPKGGEKGFGAMLGMSNKAGEIPQMTGYEPSVSSDSDSPPSSENPALILEVPLAALPQPSSSKRMPFVRSSAPANALPRPKNNLRSSNSTFVTRLQALEGLPKIMSERGKVGGEVVRWGFWNLGRTFGWGEEGGRVKDPLARVTFSQVPTCHAVSHLTASPDRVDVVVGFASGDIVWIDFIVGRYTRINKGGLLNNTAVTSITFDPRRPQHFIACFADDIMLQFNLFAEDPVATAVMAERPWTTVFDRQAPVKLVLDGHDEETYEDSMVLWKNEDWAQLSVEGQKGKKEERSPWAGKNPVAACRIGTKGITAMAYSPDGQWLAVTSDDGCLRLVDVASERLSDTFAGYFGALNCVAWAPDSRFVAVGGQDDLITIFSPRESRVVARCQGHSAFVTSICFDQRGGEGRGYRFASVGEDGKLILWDFSSASLHRPRHHVHQQNTSRHHIPASSTLSLAGQSRSQLPMSNSVGGRIHLAPPRSEVALLQPVLARVVEGNLLTGVHIGPNSIVTVSRAALVKFWQRPPKQSTSGRQRGRPASGKDAGFATATGGLGGMKSPRMEKESLVFA
ncbi:WD40-repeat-containing domain protein [Naematelia encephala]|uniref:WD40-repeat-containing domain protein n=1 Tax=Naematelia encephala TaxID=71784 RepID=A0A1Y2AHJ2_9TREE|nr:WD40-repeat-containing domain protein [Naematelia encephala]